MVNISREIGTNGRSAVQGAASFSKFMSVLQSIADHPGELDIARLLKVVPYPRPTVYRIVSGLIAEDLVREDPHDHTYHLGNRLIVMAAKTWEKSDLRSIARKFIEELRDATNETVHLAVPSGNGMAYIDKLESPNAVRMTTRIGARVEFHSTSVGKAYLSALPDDRASKIISMLGMPAYTRFTITDSETLLQEIRKTRARGYSYDHEENEADIRCFGAPIFDRSGDPVAGVSISIPLYRYAEERHGEYAELIRNTASSISQALAMAIK